MLRALSTSASASRAAAALPSAPTRKIASSLLLPQQQHGPHPQQQRQQQRLLSSSASVAQATHGGGKLKTHMGTKKRFTPVGSIAGIFKHGRAGKSHLNSHMSSVRRSRLRGTALTPPGQTARHLKRLLRPIL
ncbi:hypothetical protein V8E36_004148 [Tilletia maclaganii]